MGCREAKGWNFSSRPRIFSAQDFLRFGKKYALDYRFPDSQYPEQILEGTVEEYSFRPGMSLVRSDVRVLETYESSSLDPAPLCIVVILSGQVTLKLGSRSCLLQEQMAVTLNLQHAAQLDAHQQAGQHLKVLTLALDYASLEALQAPCPLNTGWQVWRIPTHLLQNFLCFERFSASRLMLEGLSLQLLATAFEQDTDFPPVTRIAPQDRARLEQVREMLAANPEQHHSLTELARMAAMSPTSLRNKFKHLYGQTLFSFLKAQRLERAKLYLSRGFSVQQAAHFSGYSHATNFTTAFRRHFGISPSSLHK